MNRVNNLDKNMNLLEILLFVSLIYFFLTKAKKPLSQQKQTNKKRKSNSAFNILIWNYSSNIFGTAQLVFSWSYI